jgi:hypothetical protein
MTPLRRQLEQPTRRRSTYQTSKAVQTSQATSVALTAEQLRWLLDGIDIDAMVPHPVRQYQFVG